MTENVPKTQLENSAPALERKRARGQAAKAWIKRLRLVFGAALALLVIYIAVSYRFYTLPGRYDPDLNRIQSPVTGVEKGDTLLLINMNLWRAPKIGDIVIYDHPNPREGVPEDMIGRVAGLPGEIVRRVGPTMAVGDREPLNVGFDIGPDVPIQDGDVIPEGRYLIVTDTDALAYADSRDFGYIPAGSIRRRVALNLASVLGQR